MASEKYSNDASTTLNGSINNSVTSLVVTSASNFPTSGNFRIVVDTAGNAEKMLVTAVSGTTFTVTRGIESTSAVSHSNSVAVSHVITKGGLDTIIGDNCQRGAIASLPAAEKAGRIYVPSDCPVILRDNGSTWNAFGPVSPLAIVDPAIFTQFTGGSGSTTFSSTYPMTITVNGSSPSGGHAVIAIPSTPYEILTCLDAGYQGFNNEWNYGIGFYMNGSTIATTWGAGYSGGAIKLRKLGWTSYGGPNAEDTTWSSNLVMMPWRWFKVKDDGTTLYGYISQNGLDWALLSSEARSSRVTTPTHVGVFANNQSSSNAPVVMRVLSWIQQ